MAEGSRELIDQVARSTAVVVDALATTDLTAPSLLPDWSRLTIACHLRYGAEALRWMTLDTLAGEPTSYYPEGRATQRPLTLEPRDGETPADVVSSLRAASDALLMVWRDDVADWSTPVTEPADNPDLGPVELRRLLLARLTEVEVHGTDLGIAGLDTWSDVMVRHVLPMRLEWLNTRRSNHRAVDTSVRTSWLLRATDLPVSHVVTVDGDRVISVPGDTADVVVEATGAELLALLLGRAPADLAPPEFNRALPGP